MTFKCPECGRPMANNGQQRGLATDKPLGCFTRKVICPLGHERTTVELDAGELSELRRLAYLQRLATATHRTDSEPGVQP